MDATIQKSSMPPFSYNYYSASDFIQEEIHNDTSMDIEQLARRYLIIAELMEVVVL